jgi:hypothetical protein
MMNLFFFLHFLVALSSQIPNGLCLGNWTWMYGEKVINSNGTYGETGVQNPSNVPRARYAATSSYDKNSNTVWLFGGASPSGKKYS